MGMALVGSGYASSDTSASMSSFCIDALEMTAGSGPLADDHRR
jgi:hypothetical protein